MTTTVDIPDDVLKLAMLMTGTDSAQDAVAKALEQLIKPRDQRSLIPLLGTFDDFMTPEELEKMRSMD
jgi:Arc/MetJ family transcription regulator